MKPNVRYCVTGPLSVVLMASVLMSCSKDRMADAPAQPEPSVVGTGAPKALSFFINVTNGFGTPAFGDGCNLWMNTRNGGVWFHNAVPSCLLANGFVSVGGTAAQECFTQVDCTTSNQWNWLRAAAGPGSRKWLRFRFDYSFNYTSGTGSLVTYNYTTGLWSVNTSIPGFCWELRNANDPAAPTPC